MNADNITGTQREKGGPGTGSGRRRHERPMGSRPWHEEGKTKTVVGVPSQKKGTGIATEETWGAKGEKDTNRPGARPRTRKGKGVLKKKRTLGEKHSSRLESPGRQAVSGAKRTGVGLRGEWANHLSGCAIFQKKK